MADLDINSVSVPSAVVNGQTFSLDVSVTASADSVEDGAAYRLFVFVTSLLTGGLLAPPTVIKGHLQDSPWISASRSDLRPMLPRYQEMVERLKCKQNATKRWVVESINTSWSAVGFG